MSHNQPSGLLKNDSSAWSSLQLDTYDFYLAQLCATNPVSVTQNIYSTEGQLLLAVGDLVTHNALLPLRAFTLVKPLSGCIHIQRLMNNADFLQHMVNIIRDTEFFQALEERKYPLESLRPVSEMLEQFPLVQQRLTVMAAQMGDLFQRTLSVGLWSIFIAQEMRLPIVETQMVFWAAICHDFGMMHISPHILAKEEELTAEEWRSLQGHVEISRQILREAAEFPEALINAVYEHHERSDGTGYPHGKVESEISLPGQILALADSIVGIYYNRFKPHGRRWREVIAVLELNRAAYLYRSCEIVSTMIFRSEIPLDNVVEGSDVPEFAERMLQQNVHLQQWFAELSSVLTDLGYTHGDRKLHSLQNVVLHIASTFKGSLLFKEDLRASLQSIANQQGIGINKVVEDALLRQQEMNFHLHRLTHMLQMYMGSGDCKNPKIAKKLDAGLQKIGGFLAPPTAQ
ncbi:HD-GYP domain-containing protein [Cellvibrio mixtus]|uniref:HD-GYP domain-containing protein n=1 Tax=Cellvibrio mixtus TaxID=39650 RepID=UPI0005873F40|nr:HD domain-containing phosphohydrolase [Cellvibrio mixtus]